MKYFVCWLVLVIYICKCCCYGWLGGGCNCNFFGNGWNCLMGILLIWSGVKILSWYGINLEWCYFMGWKGIFIVFMFMVCCVSGKIKGGWVW